MHDRSPTDEAKFRTCEIDVAAGEGPYFLVTAANFPAVFAACETSSHDAGFGAGHDNYAISAAWAQDLPTVEVALTSLSKEDRDTFLIGDQDEAAAIVARSPELRRAHEFFNFFFEE